MGSGAEPVPHGRGVINTVVGKATAIPAPTSVAAAMSYPTASFMAPTVSSRWPVSSTMVASVVRPALRHPRLSLPTCW